MLSCVLEGHVFALVSIWPDYLDNLMVRPVISRLRDPVCALDTVQRFLRDIKYTCLTLFCNAQLTVKGFWALWDNIITVAMVMLLRGAYYMRVLQRSTVITTSM